MLQQMLLSWISKQSTPERFVDTKDCSFGKSHSQKVRQNTTVYTCASISSLAAKMETVPMVLQWRNSEAQIESRNA